jgi:hypothetical protein
VIGKNPPRETVSIATLASPGARSGALATLVAAPRTRGLRSPAIPGPPLGTSAGNRPATVPRPLTFICDLAPAGPSLSDVPAPPRPETAQVRLPLRMVVYPGRSPVLSAKPAFARPRLPTTTPTGLRTEL